MLPSLIWQMIRFLPSKYYFLWSLVVKLIVESTVQKYPVLKSGLIVWENQESAMR